MRGERGGRRLKKRHFDHFANGLRMRTRQKAQ